MLDGSADEAEPRYRLLETPRAYALERLAAAGEEATVRARHAASMAKRWTIAYEQRQGGLVGIDEWARQLELDLDNARSAFAWGCEHDASAAVAIAPALLKVLATDGVARLAVCDSVESLLEDESLSALQRARVRLHGPPGLPVRRALEWGKRSVELFCSIGDATGRFEALGRLAWAAGITGDGEAAKAAVAEMDRLLAAPVAPLLLAVREQAGLGVAIAEQRWEVALLHCRRVGEYLRLAGGSDVVDVINALEMQINLGRFDDALRDGEQLLTRLGGTRWASTLAAVQIKLVAARLRKGAAAPARALVATAWPKVPLLRISEFLASHAALLAALEERPRAAAQLVGYADAMYAAHAETRQELEAASIERAMAIVRTRLGEAEIVSLKTTGAGLSNEAARRVALGEADVPG
jgi:hypothetical protein